MRHLNQFSGSPKHRWAEFYGILDQANPEEEEEGRLSLGCQTLI